MAASTTATQIVNSGLRLMKASVPSIGSTTKIRSLPKRSGVSAVSSDNQPYPGLAPRSPYDSIVDLLGKFDAMPAGRRAIVMFSDGLDTTQGFNLASITQSADLDRAALKAQRKGVAVYSVYAPTVTTESSAGSSVAFAAQGALAKLSEETGGRAFFTGTQAPISLLPFFRDMVVALNRQFALTYLSTHMRKGYHSVDVRSTNPEVKIEHPLGYYYR